MTIERIKVGPRMSQVVIHGATGYLAGQVADDPSADVADQTRQILAKIDRLLAEAGTDRSKLLSANVWLSDISMFDQMNAVWDEWVTPDRDRVRTVEYMRSVAEHLGQEGFPGVELRVFRVDHTLQEEELAALVAWWLGRPAERGTR